MIRFAPVYTFIAICALANIAQSDPEVGPGTPDCDTKCHMVRETYDCTANKYYHFSGDTCQYCDDRTGLHNCWSNNLGVLYTCNITGIQISRWEREARDHCPCNPNFTYAEPYQIGDNISEDVAVVKYNCVLR